MPSIDAGRPIPQTTDVEVASGVNAVNDHLHAASLQFIVMTSATSVQRLPATSSDFQRLPRQRKPQATFREQRVTANDCGKASDSKPTGFLRIFHVTTASASARMLAALQRRLHQA